MPASAVNGWSPSLLFSGYKSCLFHSIKEHLNLYSSLSLNVWGERKTQGEWANWRWNLICKGCGLQGLHRNFLHWESLLPVPSAPTAAPMHRKYIQSSMIPTSAGISAKPPESIISHALVWSTLTGDSLVLKKVQLPKGGERQWQICFVFLLKTVSLCEYSR